MPVDPDKRTIRELKRAIKKRGNKVRRLQLKRTLIDNPEGAAEVEASVGQYSSEGYNGLDADKTRKRDQEP